MKSGGVEYRRGRTDTLVGIITEAVEDPDERELNSAGGNVPLIAEY